MPTTRKILNLGEFIAARGEAHQLLLEAAELQKRWGDFKYLANVDTCLLLAQATKFSCDVDTFADWADGEYGGIRRSYADRFIDLGVTTAHELKVKYMEMPAIPELDQAGISRELAQKILIARLLRECHVTMMEELEEARAEYSVNEFAFAAQHAELAVCVHKVSLRIEAGFLKEFKFSKSLLLEAIKQIEPLRAELLAAIFNQARNVSLGINGGLPPVA